MEANHKETKYIFNKQEMTLNRGQLICGRKKLSLETGISQRSIRTAIKTLTNIGFLTTKTTNRFSILTIENYDTYQNNNSESTSKSTNKRPANTPKVTTSKEYNNEKNKNTNPDSNPGFDFIWKSYPKRAGRKEALRHYAASVHTEADIQDIKKALNNYLLSDRVKRGYIQDGSTWFNNWRDWITPPDEIQGSQREPSKEYTAEELKAIQ